MMLGMVTNSKAHLLPAKETPGKRPASPCAFGSSLWLGGLGNFFGFKKKGGLFKTKGGL